MKQLEHHNYTPFEYACQLGNISSLKLIFTHQEPQENNPIYLNGLLQSIAANQLEVTEFLFQLPAYQRIIEKHQNEIIQRIQEHGHYHLLEILMKNWHKICSIYKFHFRWKNSVMLYHLTCLNKMFFKH